MMKSDAKWKVSFTAAADQLDAVELKPILERTKDDYSHRAELEFNEYSLEVSLKSDAAQLALKPEIHGEKHLTNGPRRVYKMTANGETWDSEEEANKLPKQGPEDKSFEKSILGAFLIRFSKFHPFVTTFGSGIKVFCFKGTFLSILNFGSVLATL